MEPSLTFLVFASACTLAYLWATHLVPETANVSLEEVEKLFRAKAGSEDLLLKSEVCILH